MISYLDFKAKYPPGSSNVGDNSVDAGQCNGLTQMYFVLNGIGHIPGNAVDIYRNAPDQYFEKLPPNAQVKQGDIFVCGKPWGVNPYYNPHDKNSGPQYFGHIGFCDQPMNGQTFMGYEQNGVLSTPYKVQLVFHQNRFGFEGILRIKPQEYIMDKNDAIAYYWNTLHRVYPTQVSDDELNGLIGKKLSDVAAAERNSPQWLNQNYWVQNGAGVVAQLNAKIQALQDSPSQQQIAELKAEVASLTDTINKLENKQ